MGHKYKANDSLAELISDDFKFNKPENYEEFSQLAADRTVKALKKFIQMD